MSFYCANLDAVLGAQPSADAAAPEYKPRDQKSVDTRFLLYLLLHSAHRFQEVTALHTWLLLVAVMILSAMNRGQGRDGYYAVDNVRGLISEGEFEQGPGTGLHYRKSFWDIGNPTEFWQWMRSPTAVMQLITYPGLTFQNEVLQTTGLVGLFQVRVQPQPCWGFYQWVWEFVTGATGYRGDPTCHPQYSEAARDTVPFGPGDSTCAIWDNFTFHWTGLDWGEEFRVRGRYGHYDFQHSYPFFISTWTQNQTVVREAFDCLEREGWIDEGTRALVLRFAVMTNPDMHSQFQYLVEVNSKGGYRPSVQALSYQLSDGGWYFRIFLQCFAIAVCFVRVAWQLRVDVRYAPFYKKRSHAPGLLKMVFTFWRVYDVVLLSLAVYSVMLDVVQHNDVQQLNELAAHPHTSGAGDLVISWFQFFLIETRWERDIRWWRQVEAVVMLLAILQFLRYITLSNTFNLLVVTMRLSLTPLTFLLTGCFCVTLAYSLAAFILFGDQVSASALSPHCVIRSPTSITWLLSLLWSSLSPSSEDAILCI